jgi:methionine synthase I (cobalamin-dependent)
MQAEERYPKTVEAFLNLLRMLILSVGLNCALGAKDMSILEELRRKPFFISAYPNAVYKISLVSMMKHLNRCVSRLMIFTKWFHQYCWRMLRNNS